MSDTTQDPGPVAEHLAAPKSEFDGTSPSTEACTSTTEDGNKVPKTNDKSDRNVSSNNNQASDDTAAVNDNDEGFDSSKMLAVSTDSGSDGVVSSSQPSAVSHHRGNSAGPGWEVLNPGAPSPIGNSSASNMTEDEEIQAELAALRVNNAPADNDANTNSTSKTLEDIPGTKEAKTAEEPEVPESEEGSDKDGDIEDFEVLEAREVTIVARGNAHLVEIKRK